MANSAEEQYFEENPEYRLQRGVSGLRGICDLMLAVQDKGDLHMVSPAYLHSLLEISIEELERAQCGIEERLKGC